MWLSKGACAQFKFARVLDNASQQAVYEVGTSLNALSIHYLCEEGTA